MPLRIIAALACLALATCNGIDLGDNPQPDVHKENGPLTVPPPLTQPLRR